MEFVPDILDEVVRVVEDRYGRRAAWLAAIVGIALIIGGFALFVWYFAS